MAEEKKNKKELWEQSINQAASWGRGIYNTLYNPITLNILLYVIKNPGCTKYDIVRNLKWKYDIPRIEQSYKTLTTWDLSTTPIPMLRENKDGTVEFIPSASIYLRFFASMYESEWKPVEEELLNKFLSEGRIDIYPANFNSMFHFVLMSEKEMNQTKVNLAIHLHKMFRKIMRNYRSEIETALQEIGKHLRWMPKEEEEKILKQSVETIRSHLISLEKFLFSAIKNSYHELPFPISKFPHIEELRKKYSLDESKFLWDVGRKLHSINRLLKESNEVDRYGYKTFIEASGDVYDALIYGICFNNAIEIAKQNSSEFIERLGRVIKGKHYFTPEEWSKNKKEVMKEKLRQILFKAQYSENAKNLANELRRSSNEIKERIIGIAKTQKDAYDTLPVGTFIG